MHAKDTDRVGWKAGEPCFEIAKHVEKLSLSITSKANQVPTEPGILELKKKMDGKSQVFLYINYSPLFTW